MAQSDDLDMTIDGFDPSAVARPTRRRRKQADFDDFNAQPVNQPFASSPQQQGMGENSQPRRRVRQQQPTPQQPQTAFPDAEVQDATVVGDPTPATSQETAQSQPRQWAIVRFFTDERLRVFLGISLMLLCVFIIIALFSHFKYGHIDQSVVSNSTLQEMAQNPGSVKNAGGGFGAWLSQVLLCDTLGLGSAVYIVYAWLLSMALLGIKKCNFWSLTFKTLLVSTTISIVLGLVTYNMATPMRWGGNHGHYVNVWIMSYATVLGAIGVSALLILAVACVYLNELKQAWNKCTEKARRRRLQEQLRKEKERELEDIAEATAEPEESNPFDQPAPVSEETPLETVAADPFATEPEPLTPEQQPLPAEEFVWNTPQEEPVQPVSESSFWTSEESAPVANPFAQAAQNPFATQEAADKNYNSPQRGEAPYSPNQGKGASCSPNLEEEQGFTFFTEEEPKEEPVTIEELPALSEDVQELQMSTSDFLTFEEEPKASPKEVTQPQQKPKEEDPFENFSVVAPQIEKVKPQPQETPAQSRANTCFQPFDPRAELSRYKFPPMDLLIDRPVTAKVDIEEQQANKDQIVKTLADYNIHISSIEATVGPTITLYEIVPAEGVRISQIKRLEDDIALSLAATGIRIIAPMPGKGTVGIEVPNKVAQTVSMLSVINSRAYQESKMLLPMALGATISNEIFIADMAKMPHLLVAGATGMGKSVGLNAIVTSLLYKKHPAELKFVLIDPKMVEFSLYNKLERHYLAKLPGDDDSVVTEPLKAIQILNSLCVEMDDRYNLLKDASVRTIEEYNKKFTERRLNPANGHKYLPYIVVIVDEFADLIMLGGKEVDAPIMRIGQKARAVGIHLIIATQRPSTTVITGNIKANFPGRMAFRVIQMEDSRTILGAPGANRLIGKGDMLFSHNGNMERVQCAFMSTEEVEAVVDWIDNQPGFEQPYYLPEAPNENAEAVAAASIGERDPLFDEAARYVVLRQVGSTSSLQRQFNIGYNRAGRLMDQMEAAGIIGPVNGAKPRAILIDAAALETMLNQGE